MNPKAGAHLGDEVLTDFVADRLSSEARNTAEEHLADCQQCRKRMIEGHRSTADSGTELETEAQLPPVPTALLERARSIGEQQRPRRDRRLLAAMLAVASLGAGWWLLVGRANLPSTHLDQDPVFRLEETARSLELTEPADGALLGPGQVTLRWTPVIDATEYRVFVLDSAGRPLVEQHTEATEWSWPAAPPAAFWYVEARLADGTRIESEARQLRFSVGGLPQPP